MKYAIGCVVLGFGFLGIGGTPAQADELRPTPQVRLDTVAGNLWDVLWKNPPVRKLTADTHFDWRWFASRFDKDQDGVVVRDEFTGKSDHFTALDRNWDGKLTTADFDWTEQSKLAWRKATVFALTKAIDKSSDGRITPEEWLAAFEKVASEKGFLSDSDLESLIFQPAAKKALSDRRFFDREPQTRGDRLQKLFESGRLFTDGPRVGETAPDFTLRTPDGKTSVRLSDYRKKKPVVLVFGSFT